MRKSYAPHLEVIRDSIAAIERYQPVDKATFLGDSLVQDAVLMRLQVIGEHLAGIRRIDAARFADIAPQAWYQLIGLRNVISHGYERIDREYIWEMISIGLQDLADSLTVLDDV